VAPRRIRIELDEPGARALHAALAAALATDLLDADEAATARGVLEQLDRRVPEWVADTADPYLSTVDAILDVLAGEARTEDQLAAALGAGGASLRTALDRMAKERLVRRTEHRGRAWIAAAPAGRRRRAAEVESPGEPEALVDLLYAEHRPGRWAHRPCVQAIGRLDDAAFEPLAGALRARGLLEPADPEDQAALTLTDEGASLARARWAAISPEPHWRIPPPPLPYRPLPVRVRPEDRVCPSPGCESRAAWLKPGSRSAAWRALVRDGSVEWRCDACSRAWLVYLQAHDDGGAPAYRDPADGDHNRPRWRGGR
jgi:hypothetical protein